MVAGGPRSPAGPPPLPKLPLVLGGEHACALAIGGALGPQAVHTETSVFVAAKERKERKKAIVCADPDGYPWVERSDLCEEARQAVRGWARGHLSVRQCLLLLERSAEVARLLEDEVKQTPAAKEEAEEEERQNDAGLWVVGCPGLGGCGPGLGVFASYLESVTPRAALADAWKVVETQCGASASRLSAGEVNLALRRLSQRARVGGPDPAARFLQVQVWRELLQLSTDMERSDSEAAGGEGDLNCSVPSPDAVSKEDTEALERKAAVLASQGGRPFKLEEDKGLLCWLACSEEELRQQATEVPTVQLQRDVVTAEKYAVQLLRLSNRLRRAIDGWSRFDAYRVLGISRSATLAEIRRAFYKKALQTHPDKGGEKEAFQEIQNAYNEILDEKGANRVRNECEEEDSSEKSKQEAQEWEQWEQEREEREDRRKRREEERRHKSEEAKKQQEEEQQKTTKQGQDSTAAAEDSDTDDDDDDEAPESDGEATASNPGDDGVPGGGGKNSWGQHSCRQQKQRRALKKVAKEAQEAAEKAGEHATRALRRCHAVIDMLEGQVDHEQSWIDAAQAVQETGRVATATKVTGQSAGVVAGILEQISEESARYAGSIESPCEAQPASSVLLNEAAQAAATAASSSHCAAAECAAASMQTSSTLRAARCQNIAMAQNCRGPDPGVLQRAIHPLLDVVKSAAVTALEAAEACMEACAVSDQVGLKEKVCDAAEGEATAQADSGQGGDPQEDKENHGENLNEGMGTEDETKGVKTIADLEARRARAAWLDIRRVLRRANAEASELFARARNLVHRHPGVVPQLPCEQQSRLFALLAEFFDAAALDFHTMLQRGEPPLEPLLQKSVTKAFGFVLNAEPRLPVSVDPRVQILRAALVVDYERVKDMLDNQLPRRLESSVKFVCSMRGSLHTAEAFESAAFLLKDTHHQLVHVLEELSSSIQ